MYSERTASSQLFTETTAVFLIFSFCLLLPRHTYYAVYCSDREGEGHNRFLLVRICPHHCTAGLRYTLLLVVFLFELYISIVFGTI